MGQHTRELLLEKIGCEPKPCLRCGSQDLSLWDVDFDGFYEITCKQCGLEHTGAFASDTVRSWNTADSIEDLKPFLRQIPDKRKLK